MSIRLERILTNIGGPIGVVAAGELTYLKNVSEDIEILTDIAMSWWDPDEGWLGTAEEIKESMLHDFPDHSIEIELEDRSISYRIKGKRLDFYCVQKLIEDEVYITGELAS
jgi:hypothetical protein